MDDPPVHGTVYFVSSEHSPRTMAARRGNSKAPAPVAWLVPDKIEARGHAVIELDFETGLATAKTPLSMELLKPDSSWDGLFWDAVVLRPGKVRVTITNWGFKNKHPKPTKVCFSPRERKELFPEVKFDLDKVII